MAPLNKRRLLLWAPMPNAVALATIGPVKATEAPSWTPL